MFGWYKNASLSAKMILALLMGGVSLLLVGVISFINLEKVIASYDHVAKVNLPKLDHLGTMRARSARFAVELLRAQDLFTEGQSADKTITRLHEHRNKFLEAVKNYKSVEFVEGEESIFRPIIDLWEKNSVQLDQAIAIIESRNLGRRGELDILVNQLLDSLDEQIVQTIKLADFQHDEGVKHAGQANTIAYWGQMILIGTIAFFFAMSILVGVMISRSLSSRLRVLAGDLNKGADKVSTASQDIAGTAQELSQATTEQAASLEETAASIEEMASMVAKNSENSKSTASLAAQSHSSANRGADVVRAMIDSMGEINQSNQDIMTAVNQSNKEISEIIKVITEIGNKTKVINDIVFQTKLLSFNASVEAARAGEHGKGFAVVAEEVGNLAQMSGNAAKEISTMLEASIQKVEGIVRETQNRVEHLIDAGRTKVEHGTSVAHQCGEVLHEIVGNVSQVTKMAEEISAASIEQSKGISEISKAMSQLDHITQQNAHTSDVTANSSEQLSSQATHLRETVGQFVREIEGGGYREKVPPVERQTRTNVAKVSQTNVVALRPKVEKKRDEIGGSKKSASNEVSERTPKRVANAGSSSVSAGTPSFDDSRFEDV